MKARETFLSRLDNSLRWTGIPDRLADEMSDAPSVDYKHRPLRWSPLWPIAFSCAVFILCLTWPPQADLLSPGAVIAIFTGLMTSIVGAALCIHLSGPLGKPSIENDEREAALRRDSFLFCLGLLAFLNCLGQPVLMVLSHWQDWSTLRSLVVAASALVLNGTLIGCLPTLYASWKVRPLPKE